MMTAAVLIRQPQLRVPARTTRRLPLWSWAVLAGVSLLVLSPFASLLLTAAEGDAEIWPHLAANVLPAALRETALLLAGVALLTGVIGVGTAWLVTAHRFPGRNFLAWLLPLPLAVPTYITAYVYVELFDSAGPVQMALRGAMGWTSRNDYWFPEVRSLPGAVVVMSFVLYPYVYMTARTMFLTQSACMVEVARTLGASRGMLFRTVALPLARPALAVGLSLALLEALNDIGASEYLGVRTLTVSVFTTWLNRGSLPGAAQIACFMLAVVIGLVWLERRGRRDRRYALSTRRSRVAQPVTLPRWGGLAALAACALPVLLGFGIPMGFLIGQVAERGLLSQVDGTFVWHLLTTVALAAAATLVALCLGIVVVTASRLARGGFAGSTQTIAGLGYAVPGTVLALGLFGPLVGVDNALNTLWRAATGERLGLVLMGSGAAIVIAYTIRFLPISTGSLAAGLDRVSPGIEDAARTLGARPRELVLRVQLPLLRPALASAALLVFVDCLKELPATLLLRPLNLETLATLVYGHAARGQFENGALAALLIVLVGIVPVIQLTRGAETRRDRASHE
ncbi:MAG TPA: iron ABC transporter permease [Microvirga sp.]|jgi:iron(III) transport system permease protein|nr:iron ABC transporter permease [Microvirga sp.]